jgi:hypothetical protein
MIAFSQTIPLTLTDFAGNSFVAALELSRKISNPFFNGKKQSVCRAIFTTRNEPKKVAVDLHRSAHDDCASGLRYAK